METQPGGVNWASINNWLDKGEVRAMAWHDIGHGADTVSYWQWRSALNGQEQYHGTLVGPDGTPDPLLRRSRADWQRVREGKSGAGRNVGSKSEVAILHSYDSRWAIDWQKHNKNYDPVEEILSYYGPLRAIAQSVDIVLSTARAEPLQAGRRSWPECADGRGREESDRRTLTHGGHLVLGQRSAMKDDDNALWPQRQPGPLVDLLGGRVEQYYALVDTVPVEGKWGPATASSGRNC